MTPTEEIIPGFNIPKEELVYYAENQPEYTTLPMWRDPYIEDINGYRCSRWKLTWKERLQVLFGGSLWLSVLTFDRPLQPVLLQTVCPLKINNDR